MAGTVLILQDLHPGYMYWLSGRSESFKVSGAPPPPRGGVGPPKLCDFHSFPHKQGSELLDSVKVLRPVFRNCTMVCVCCQMGLKCLNSGCPNHMVPYLPLPTGRGTIARGLKALRTEDKMPWSPYCSTCQCRTQCSA
jgi:hypothetical protein